MRKSLIMLTVFFLNISIYSSTQYHIVESQSDWDNLFDPQSSTYIEDTEKATIELRTIIIPTPSEFQNNNDNHPSGINRVEINKPNVHFKILKGGGFDFSSLRVYLNATFEAGLYQIFYNYYNYHFKITSNSVPETYPEWFGASSGTTTSEIHTNNIAIQTAISAHTNIKLNCKYRVSRGFFFYSNNFKLSGSGYRGAGFEIRFNEKPAFDYACPYLLKNRRDENKNYMLTQFRIEDIDIHIYGAPTTQEDFTVLDLPGQQASYIRDVSINFLGNNEESVYKHIAYFEGGPFEIVNFDVAGSGINISGDAAIFIKPQNGGGGIYGSVWNIHLPGIKKPNIYVKSPSTFAVLNEMQIEDSPDSTYSIVCDLDGSGGYFNLANSQLRANINPEAYGAILINVYNNNHAYDISNVHLNPGIILGSGSSFDTAWKEHIKINDVHNHHNTTTFSPGSYINQEGNPTKIYGIARFNQQERVFTSVDGEIPVQIKNLNVNNLTVTGQLKAPSIDKVKSYNAMRFGDVSFGYINNIKLKSGEIKQIQLLPVYQYSANSYKIMATIRTTNGGFATKEFTLLVRREGTGACILQKGPVSITSAENLYGNDQLAGNVQIKFNTVSTSESGEFLEVYTWGDLNHTALTIIGSAIYKY